MHHNTGADMTLAGYEFPASRLRSRIESRDRVPVVFVACGSFSPITNLHLRMFELAADHARFNTEFEVVGAYISCVGDSYKKAGLAESEHRINMCDLAVQSSTWVSVDPWESLYSEYLETARVLDHFEYEINEIRGGVQTPAGKRKCRIALLAGTDLVQTMATPGLWAQADVEYILKNFGMFIVEVIATPSTASKLRAARLAQELQPDLARMCYRTMLTHSLTCSARADLSTNQSPRCLYGGTTPGSFHFLCTTRTLRRKFVCSYEEACRSGISYPRGWSSTSRRMGCIVMMLAGQRLPTGGSSAVPGSHNVRAEGLALLKDGASHLNSDESACSSG